MAKISENYYNKCTEIEKKYILERANTDGVSRCKMVISAVRKQDFYPALKKLYGYGIAEVESGQSYKFTGDMTRTFKPI